ncbi:MAG: hypothetical protein ABEJ02_01955 [Candidatus Paceibacteria bacterium]
MDFLKRVGKKVSQNKIKIGLVFVLSVLIFVVSPDIALAQEDIGFIDMVFDPADATASLIIWMLMGLAKLFQELTLAFLEFFIQIAEYNNFANEGVVKLGWTMVRDVANMFFVVALLVIAFANILGLSNYEMKKTLPTLFLMAILVNFSKLIAGVIIDAAHVFTMTFLNAIAATAGGNLVGAMHMGDVFKYVSEKQGTAADNLGVEMFFSAVLGIITSLVAMLTIGAYMLIMLIRMVVLWILIILSPIAFVAASLPKTKSKFTSDWWSRFLNHVLVAPVMVFFLWLAFATMGSGNIGQKIADYGSISHDLPNTTIENASSGMASWDVLLSYIVAIGFMWAGLEFVQSELNVRGGEIAGKAKGAMKGAMTYAPRKAMGRAKEAASDYATLAGEKTKLNRLPIVGSQSAGRIKRKAAVDQAKKRQDERKKSIEARAKTPGAGGGGLAGKIAPSHESIAKEEVKRSNLEDIKERKERGMKEDVKEEAEDYEAFEEEKNKLAQREGFDSFDEAKEAVRSDEHDFDIEDLQDLEFEAAGNVGQGGANEAIDFLFRAKGAIPGLERETPKRGMHMAEADVTERYLKKLDNFLGDYEGSSSELRGDIKSSYDELRDEFNKPEDERDSDKISGLRRELARKLPQAINRGLKDELGEILDNAPDSAFDEDPERAMMAMKHGGDDYGEVGLGTQRELEDDLGDTFDSSLYTMKTAAENQGEDGISGAITQTGSKSYDFSGYAGGEYEENEEGGQERNGETEVATDMEGGAREVELEEGGDTLELSDVGADDEGTSETEEEVSNEELNSRINDLHNRKEELSEEIGQIRSQIDEHSSNAVEISNDLEDAGADRSTVHTTSLHRRVKDAIENAPNEGEKERQIERIKEGVSSQLNEETDMDTDEISKVEDLVNELRQQVENNKIREEKREQMNQIRDQLEDLQD